jgi:uncharacterized protein YecE (DUF72 family)
MAVDGRARSSRRAPTIGCSGWNYASWRGRFYPERLPPSRWFQHYASVFNTVEINNTFYRLPEASTFDRWREQSPRDFCFAVKASRFLTHMKRLREPKEPIRRLFSRVTLDRFSISCLAISSSTSRASSTS